MDRMDTFLDYMKHMEQDLPREDKEYFCNVTKPLFERLYKETEKRLKEIGDRFDTGQKSETVQTQIKLGNVSVNEVKYIKNMAPVIDINRQIESVSSDQKRIEFKKKINLSGNVHNRKELFSVICDCTKERFIQMAGQRKRAVLIFSSGEEKGVVLSFRINHAYEKVEDKLERIIRNNRIDEEYFRIPLCRRILDVYLDLEDESGDVCDMIGLQLEEPLGKVAIPMWNLVESLPKMVGDVRCSPYGKSGERNLHIGVLAVEDKMVINCLASYKDKLEHKFLYTVFSDRELTVYDFEKSYLTEEFVLYYVNNCKRDLGYVHDLMDFEVIKNIHYRNHFFYDISEAMVISMVNGLSPITGYEADRITCTGENNCVFITLSKTGDGIGNNCYDKEMEEFIVSCLKRQCPQYQFILE